MGRKSNTKDSVLLPPEIINTNVDVNNNQYRKRLRSWKKPLSRLKANHSFDSSSHIDDNATSHRKSTIYTYPINLSNDCQSMLSNTVLSESLTTKSALCCSSTSCHSIRTMDDLNNNQKITLNIETRKRKNSIPSRESFSSQISQFKTLEILPNSNNEKNISTNQSSSNNLQLTHPKSPTKRSCLSIEDSNITNHRSINSPLLVDIIFNAFEDQLRKVLTKTSSVHLITLHAVNFNIQLAAQQQTMSSFEKLTISEQYLTNENHHSRSISLTELK